ncbi:tRNA lysidine(34) synthetase TilS [Luteimonas vadosa]|uniref:tRNA(Ile)-lysidine synthase n=1 Tax=Luteimonas vadosa TaxID=1165507 RepID=A0ABP9E902_9GAMM
MAEEPASIPLPALPWDRRPGALHVGYSGGLDSTVLLHLLHARQAEHGLEVRAIHVHHGLHPDADAWSAHCRQQCDALGFGLRIVRVHVEEAGGTGREAAARDARMAAFAAGMRQDDVLALAHHRDDQAETFLLRALRASGVDGLGAMRAWRPFADGWLWRPLLDVPREDVLAYARTRDLAWIEDPSNLDESLDRNFLRHRVLPLLRQRWPRAGRALADSAALAGTAASLLSGEDHAALGTVAGDVPDALSVPALAALPAARRARVLRAWVERRGLPALPANGVARIESDLLAAAPDGQAEFLWQGAFIRHWRGQLHAGRVHPPLPPTWRVPWDGRTPLHLPGGGALRLEPTDAGGFDEPIQVHARQGGESIRLPGRAHRHALKQVLQDMDLPPWQRKQMPLVSDGQGVLLAAGDIALSEDFDRWLQARGAKLRWVRAS